MKSLAVCCLLIAACEIARPEGSFLPEPPPESPKDAGRDAGRRDGGVRNQDARVVARPDAAVVRASDGGGRADGDSGSEPAEDHPLAALHGRRFLARMDMYSSVMTSTTPRLTLDNRVSNLLLVDFTLQGDELVGSEVLCEQTYEHACRVGCDAWETYVDEGVLDFFARSEPVSRRYTYDEAKGELRAETASLALGFDESDSEALPSSSSDERVWQVGSGSGVYTHMTATVPVLGRPQTVACEVSGVQRFKTNFAGKVAKDTLALEGVVFNLNTDATEAAVLEVTGTPRTQCTKSQFEGQAAQKETSQVRFLAYDEGDACPANFDEVFAPAPRFMP